MTFIYLPYVVCSFKDITSFEVLRRKSEPRRLLTIVNPHVVVGFMSQRCFIGLMNLRVEICF